MFCINTHIKMKEMATVLQYDDAINEIESTGLSNPSNIKNQIALTQLKLEDTLPNTKLMKSINIFMLLINAMIVIGCVCYGLFTDTTFQGKVICLGTALLNCMLIGIHSAGIYFAENMSGEASTKYKLRYLNSLLDLHR